MKNIGLNRRNCKSNLKIFIVKVCSNIFIYYSVIIQEYIIGWKVKKLHIKEKIQSHNHCGLPWLKFLFYIVCKVKSLLSTIPLSDYLNIRMFY